jgi:hypothetical protein|tara:strand:- start:1353 stop:1682 length:330 start_codon:yes stop_codon:yes gene_type:complete
MVVIRNFLPGLTRIVKIRKKRLEATQQTGSAFADESNSTNSSYESLLINSADSSRNVVSGTLQDSSVWLKGSLETLSHKEYPGLNQEFVELNGKIRSKYYILREVIKIG